MTLYRWLVKYGWKAQDCAGSLVVPIGPGEEGYYELYRLSDYRVSSVIAGAVWLRRK